MTLATVLAKIKSVCQHLRNISSNNWDFYMDVDQSALPSKKEKGGLHHQMRVKYCLFISVMSVSPPWWLN